MHFTHTYYRLSKTEKIEFLKNEMKFDKSRICRRAYWLIHNRGLSQSEAMKKCWNEAKEYRAKLKHEIDCVENPFRPITNESFVKFINIKNL